MRVPTARSITDIPGREKTQARGVRAHSRSGVALSKAIGRRARLIELDPKYADVIVQRWQDQTGQTAKLEASGESFGEMVSRKRTAA